MSKHYANVKLTMFFFGFPRSSFTAFDGKAEIGMRENLSYFEEAGFGTCVWISSLGYGATLMEADADITADYLRGGTLWNVCVCACKIRRKTIFYRFFERRFLTYHLLFCLLTSKELSGILKM